MKKLNKLFAILFAVLGVGNLSAQVNWTSKTNLLTNPSFETDAAISDLTACGWATDRVTGWTIAPTSPGSSQIGVGNASSKIQGIGSTFSPSEGSNYFYTRNNWNAETEYSISQTISSDLPAGLYKVTCKAATFSSDAALRTIELSLQEGSSDPVCQNGIVLNVWNTWGVILVKGSDDTPLTIKARMIPGYAAGSKHYAMLLDDFQLEYISLDDYASASESDPIDFSALINNSTIYNHQGTTAGMPRGWTAYKHTTGNGNYTEKGQCDTRLEGWSGGNLDIDYYQTINNLPKGKYRVTALAQERSGNGLTSVYIYSGGSDPDRATGAVGTTEMDYTTGSLLVTSGTANIGIQSTAKDWVTADNFRIEYVGADLTLLQEEFAGHYSNLQGLTTNNVPTAYANKISNLLSTYATTPDNAKDLQTANATISAVVSEHPTIAAAYESLSAFITLCTEYTQNSNANSDEVLNAFNAAITAATTNGNAAITVDAINAAYSTLETARQEYARNAVPVYPYPFDMTFMLPNTTFDSNTDGWAKTGGANWMNAGNVECYNTTFEFSMEYSGLNNGSWEIQVDAFYRYGGDGPNTAETAHSDGTEQLYAILYANNNTVTVKSIMEGANAAGNYGTATAGGVYVPNAPSHCDAYFATGCYTNYIATVIADGNLKVGIKKESTQSKDWTIFDNFKLIYKGIDVTDLQTALSELVEKADVIKEEKMGATESTALTNALSAADATVTDADDLSKMISDLQSAYDNAVASVDTYSRVLAYITKANTIDGSIAASYQSAYDNGSIEGDAETVRQALNVATYNWVSNTFKNEIQLTEWSAASNAMGATSGQHWDGTSTTYYDANGTNTTHTLSKTVELTPGTYVFRGAGRSNSNTELSLSISIDGIAPVVFNAKGDVGYGIDTEGNATFAEDAAYANDDKGRGWEWEFIKFTLTETTTVTLTATSKTTGWGWASFANNGLWMDDATYVTVYGKELAAPLAEAKALVGTKPMGTEEYAALVEAIAQAEGTISTPAELNTAVDDLKTAVANANVWVTDYNAEKDTLVAALERFEADYNNAENGALDYMAKSRWATVIEKAQAAAVAKDVTNSYAGFEDATNELLAALDAATVSVNEYAALDNAITEAEAVAAEGAANWGDEPFQRPESAREGLNTAIANAQAGYDNRDVDGGGVTALIDAMVVTLNAPEAGNVYSMTVAIEGHGYNDCPVVATLGSTGDNNPTGYGFAAKKDADNYPLASQLYTFTQVEGNKYNISVKVKGETVYLTYGELNGSAAGWKKEQIQGNTDKEKAGEFEIVASATTEGVFKIRNTITGTNLDCQDDGDSNNPGSIYTDGNRAKEDFALTSVNELSADISISAENKFSTCVLMFDADLTAASGLTVYVPEKHEDGYLILNVFTENVLPAYTPCLLYAEDGYEGTLSGTVVMEGYAAKVTGADGVLYGAIEDQTISAGYVLQKKPGEEVAKFYNINGREGTIPAGKCWLDITTTTDTSSVTCLFRGGDANNIDEVMVDKNTLDGAIYTLDGKRVSRMERGKIYIINGQKVMVK